MNVLLAEDDKVQSRILERHLTGRGYAVRTSCDRQRSAAGADTHGNGSWSGGPNFPGRGGAPGWRGDGAWCGAERV